MYQRLRMTRLRNLSNCWSIFSLKLSFLYQFKTLNDVFFILCITDISYHKADEMVKSVSRALDDYHAQPANPWPKSQSLEFAFGNEWMTYANQIQGVVLGLKNLKMVLEPWPASDPPTTEGQLAKADIDAKVVHLSPYWFRQSVDWDTRAMNLIHEGSHLFHTRDSWYKDPQTGKLSAIRVKDINDKNKSSVISGCE